MAGTPAKVTLSIVGMLINWERSIATTVPFWPILGDTLADVKDG